MVKRDKLYWLYNVIVSCVVLLILLIVFLCRYFVTGSPVNENWIEEIMMYAFMWVILSVIVCVTFYVPIRGYADYIAKKKGYNEIDAM